MFKRTIVAVITFAALLCSLLTVEAAATENYGNGNGREDFHQPVWKVPDVPTTAPTPVKPQPKPEPVQPPTIESTPEQKDDEWLIYWYVCGTDIESDRDYGDDRGKGDVTRCIREIEKADISSGNVKILMQAGGTKTWWHSSFTNNNGKVGYYLYDNSHRDWQPLEALTPINPSDSKTLMSTTEGLTAFLEYGKKLEQQLYSDPSRIHRVFIFVDHGNGSLNGLCNDAYGNGDALHLTEMHDAFDTVWGNSPQNPPFDVVAFDTCLMSTYETAVALEGTARYMVASQETIVGFVMFGYTGLLNELSSKPMMTAEDFGRVICDTYEQDTELQSHKELYPVITLSLIDISKMPLVEAAYENFGNAALNYCQKEYRGATDTGFVSYFGTAANSAERYPSAAILTMAREDPNQTPAMVDLKTFAEGINLRISSANLQRASGELVDAINQAVIYNDVRGEALNRGGGLSTYYPYGFNKGDIDKFSALADVNFAPKAQRDFYKYMFEAGTKAGNLNFGTVSNLSGGKVNSGDSNVTNPSAPQSGIKDLSELGFDALNVEVNDYYHEFSISLNEKQIDSIAAVRAQLVCFEADADNGVLKVLYLGGDTSVKADWKRGKFTSNFDGRWITLEGKPVFVYVVSENVSLDENGNKIGGSELYSVPINLNGRICNLLITCNYPEETFHIIGAVPQSQGTISSGEILPLSKGDVVKPIFAGMILSEKDMKAIWAKYPDPSKLTDEQKIELLKELAATRNFGLVDDMFEIVIGDTVALGKRPLPNGTYAYAFEFVNPFGGFNATSRMNAVFLMNDGEIVASTDSADIDDLEILLESGN